MKRRDFLKGILATPAILNIPSKPSEVEKSDSVTVSASASCEDNPYEIDDDNFIRLKLK